MRWRSGLSLMLALAITSSSISGCDDESVDVDGAGKPIDASNESDDASKNLCSGAPPAGCCCQLDVRAAFLCDNGNWVCPPGYYGYNEDECKCPGPCCLSIDVYQEPPVEDASADSLEDADSSDAPEATDAPSSDQ